MTLGLDFISKGRERHGLGSERHDRQQSEQDRGAPSRVRIHSMSVQLITETTGHLPAVILHSCQAQGITLFEPIVDPGRSQQSSKRLPFLLVAAAV
jgi:hypothetical protein